MPTPKFLRKFSSKGSSDDPPVVSPGAISTIHTEEIPPETPTIADSNVPQYSGAMQEAWNAANVELPQAHGVEKFLNTLGTLIVLIPRRLCANVDKGQVQNAVTLSDGQETVVDTLAVPSKALMDASQIANAIEKGVNTFTETIPVLMKALDEVAKVHPFIAGMGESVPNTQVLTSGLLVAVTAFKAVYTLEVTRRSNDQRVVALYVEYAARDSPRYNSPHYSTSRMRDMMGVLVQCVLPSIMHCSPDRNVYRLKDVSDPKKVAPNGQTIEGRMQELCAGVAKDITRCANTCDTYLKLVLVVCHLHIS